MSRHGHGALTLGNTRSASLPVLAPSTCSMMCPAQIADATSDLQQLRAEMTQLSGNVTVVTQRASCECWHSACMHYERAAQGIWASVVRQTKRPTLHIRTNRLCWAVSKQTKHIMAILAPCHQHIPTVYPPVLAATLRRVGLNASATNRAVAALQALPTALDSVASSVQGGIDVLNNTVQQASLPAQPREEAQKSPKLTVDRKAQSIVFGLCRGGSFEKCNPSWSAAQCRPSPADGERYPRRLGGPDHVHSGHVALHPHSRQIAAKPTPHCIRACEREVSATAHSRGRVSQTGAAATPAQLTAGLGLFLPHPPPSLQCCLGWPS